MGRSRRSGQACIIGGGDLLVGERVAHDEPGGDAAGDHQNSEDDGCDGGGSSHGLTPFVGGPGQTYRCRQMR